MTQDSNAIVTLCSHLCRGSNVQPLDSHEWGELAKKLVEKKMRPSDILSIPRHTLAQALDATEEYAQRLFKLIDRGPSLMFEIKNYEDIGIGIVTRADEKYPQRIKRVLGNRCPPLFYYAGDLALLEHQNVTYSSSDALSEEATVEAGIPLIEFIGDSMLKKMKKGKIIKAIQNGKLLLLSISTPDAPSTPTLSALTDACLRAMSADG